MIVIRQQQMALFGADRRRRFIDRMCAHLRAEFGEELRAVDAAALRGRVAAALTRAQGHGLDSERDCCRYLNLAAVYGWDFELGPGNEWMAGVLADARISTPSQRLGRLLDLCIHRSEVAESNQRLRAESGMPADDLVALE